MKDQRGRHGTYGEAGWEQSSKVERLPSTLKALVSPHQRQDRKGKSASDPCPSLSGEPSETGTRKSTVSMAIPGILHREGPVWGTRLWTEERTDRLQRTYRLPQKATCCFTEAGRSATNPGHALRIIDISNCICIFT